LQQNEGLFLRRIDRGLEEIAAEKQRYIALANFGHSGSVSASIHSAAWPGDTASLLARAIHEMWRRIRPLRDAAAWRIIDAAKSIQKALAEEERNKERSPWEQVSRIDGMSLLCDILGVPVPAPESWKQELQASVNFRTSASFRRLDPEDAALRFASLLDRLICVATDLGQLADDEAVPDTGGVSYILEEVLQAVSYVHEDLLAVLDDATEDSLAAWFGAWSKWGEACTGARLEAAMSAMPLKADSLLQRERRQARQPKLALMRGLQALLDDSSFRTCLLRLAVVPLGTAGETAESTCVVAEEAGSVVIADTAKVMGADVFALSEPPSLAVAPASPRSSYACRKPPTRNLEESSPPEAALDVESGNREPVCSVEAEARASSSEATKPSPEGSSEVHSHKVAVPMHAKEDSCMEVIPTRPTSSRPDTASRVRCGSKASTKQRTRDFEGSGMPATPGRASSSTSRPVTPSWLEPPWPRQAQEVPFNSWTRPGTPSTVCDEADLVQSSPKWKFVDGQCIPLRPASSCKRLPPLSSPGGSKRAW
jgi:hypothetical protein